MVSLEPTLFAIFAADDKILHLKAAIGRLTAELARARTASIPIPRSLASGLRRLFAGVRQVRLHRPWLGNASRAVEPVLTLVDTRPVPTMCFG